METKDRGILTIETDSDNQKRVIFNPVNGTVWLTKSELIELFGVYRQTVNACIDAIFKANVFHAEDNSKCHLIASKGKSGIRYDPYEFNLMFVIAMAFRVDSENTGILREWILNQIPAQKSIFLQIPITNIPNYKWN